jgi:hypothetical protein
MILEIPEGRGFMKKKKLLFVGILFISLLLIAYAAIDLLEDVKTKSLSDLTSYKQLKQPDPNDGKILEFIENEFLLRQQQLVKEKNRKLTEDEINNLREKIKQKVLNTNIQHQSEYVGSYQEQLNKNLEKLSSQLEPFWSHEEEYPSKLSNFLDKDMNDKIFKYNFLMENYGKPKSTYSAKKIPVPSFWWPQLPHQMDNDAKDLLKIGKNVVGGIALRWWDMMDFELRIKEILGLDHIPEIQKLSPMEKYDYIFNQEQAHLAAIVENFNKVNNDNPYVNRLDESFVNSNLPGSLWELVNHTTHDKQNGWFGHCNGWTSWAILKDAPQKTVFVQLLDEAGKKTEPIAFHISDIEALLSEVYFEDDAGFVGTRVQREKIETDKLGRYVSLDARDVNAGLFFIAITNFIGGQKLALAADIDAGIQVWNFPYFEYTVEELDSMKIKNNSEGLNKALGWMGVGRADLKNKKETKINKLDFNITTEKIQSYFKQQVDTAKVVLLSTKIISDSVLAGTEPLISPDGQLKEEAYSKAVATVNYMILLELNEKGTVVGGEWLGYKIDVPKETMDPDLTTKIAKLINSKQKHPDFLWNPTYQHTFRDKKGKYIDNIKIGEQYTLDIEHLDADNPFVSYNNVELLRLASTTDPKNIEDLQTKLNKAFNGEGYQGVTIDTQTKEGYITLVIDKNRPQI